MQEEEEKEESRDWLAGSLAREEKGQKLGEQPGMFISSRPVTACKTVQRAVRGFVG